ncbi:MAG: hypothetical protein QNI90_02480 [Dinoroseobacter sp.]|nr:hypothetical protein [Dinoroseobacter sp.]
MFSFLAIVVLLALLGVCLLQLSKHGMIDLPSNMNIPKPSEDKTED